jgi:hypothetical protein
MEQEQFEFDYKKNKSILSDDILDGVMKTVLSSSKGKFQTIIAGITMIFFFVYLACKKSLRNERELIERQMYRQSRSSDNRDDVNDRI